MPTPSELLRIARYEGARVAVRIAASAPPKAERAKPDESAIAHAVLRDSQAPRTMIDVGAHYGKSLKPFFAFGLQRR